MNTSLKSCHPMLIVSDGRSNYFVRDRLVPAVTPEEELITLLKFANVRRIREFVAENPSMNLHHPTFDLVTPLLQAIRREDQQILSLLIDKISTDLNDTSTQPYGRTVLMSAAFSCIKIEILHVLLKKGANAKKLDVRGWSCLQYAIVGERAKSVEFLLDFGLDIEMRDFDDRTPLMIAVLLSNSNVLSLLLERGADIKARDKKGFTPLQLAILRKKRNAAITLMNKGSEINEFTPMSNNTSPQEFLLIMMPGLIPRVQENLFD